MIDRNRERQRRQNDNDWDWDYYYQYRYVPFSPYRRNDYDRYYYDRNDDDRDYNSIFGTNPYSNSIYGRYSGVGPRGYQRSDDRISDDVNDRLTWHGGIDASDIEVNVNDGLVTLTGNVESRREKRMAEDAAESVPGVWDVSNQLRIRNRGGSRGGELGMNNRQTRPGMEVIGMDGEMVGEVKEVRSNDFLVDRAMARDVYVPMSACQTTDGRIRLNIRADEVDNQGWEMPELLGTQGTQKSASKR